MEPIEDSMFVGSSVPEVPPVVNSIGDGLLELMERIMHTYRWLWGSTPGDDDSDDPTADLEQEMKLELEFEPWSD